MAKDNGRGPLARLLPDADAIVIVDRQGCLVSVNSQTEDLFGYAKDELLGKTVEILVPHRFRERHRAHRLAYDAEPRVRRTASGLELPGLRKDGTEFPMEISLSPIETSGERWVVASMRDVTRRQEQLRREQAARAEAESLARSNAELCREAERAREQAEKARAEAEAASRAKDDFLLMLSHELRTPLTPIFLWTGMLRQPDLPRDVATRALDGIERAARSEVRLIEDLLDVSRIIAGKLHLEQEPVALAGVVEAALEAVRSAAAAKTVVIAAAVAEEALVLGDAHRLEQVVINLLVNAVKFSYPGGRVTIRVEHRGTEVQLSVRDNGHGIAPAFLRRVFTRFEQAETSMTRTHGGLGLGLTIVRHLVERHGGKVRAESAGLDQGATFTVTLPAWQVPAAAPPPIAGERFEGMANLSGLRILVVDDDPETGQGLETLLTSRGAETRTAVSAAEARALLARWPADLLISDIAMPEEDGYTLIHQIRAETRPSRLPAIALTAYARTEDRRDAFAAGFDEYVTKPVESRKLLGAITTLVHARRSALSAIS